MVGAATPAKARTARIMPAKLLRGNTPVWYYYRLFYGIISAEVDNTASYLLQSPVRILRALGERIRARRISARLQQASLARRAGVSRKTVLRLEKGENVGAEQLLRVALALDAGDEFNALFPKVETRSLDEILASQQRPAQRVRTPRIRRVADKQ